MREHMRATTAEPHVAGRPSSKKVAEYALQQFKSFGLDASIEEYEAYMPWPIERRLDGGPGGEDDGDSGAAGAGGSRFHRRRPDADLQRLIGDGDVTGEVVYVNYGVPADYEQLENSASA